MDGRTKNDRLQHLCIYIYLNDRGPKTEPWDYFFEILLVTYLNLTPLSLPFFYLRFEKGVNIEIDKF